MSMKDELIAGLQALRRRDLFRVIRDIEGPQERVITIDGRPAVNFASNNYLGLANHPALREAGIRALRRWGVGAGASRLVTGSSTLHRELEERIARFEDLPAAVLFNSGYCANVGVIASLVGRGDAVFGDRLNHASIVDGCLLSGARFQRYKHRDADDLARLLAASESRRKLVVTDSIFSVDGDAAPLDRIADVCAEYGAWLMVDEAHATGVLGDHGRGLVEVMGLGGRVEIVMGTLSKALGCVGGYVAGCAELADHLRNHARSLIYTTALPPALCAAAIAAFDVLEREPERRVRLSRNAERLRAGLRRAGWDTGSSETQILPILVGEARTALELSARLLEAGYYAPAMRPPTVPPGACRLRVSVTAAHLDKDIDGFLEALGQAPRP
ncbi:MAG TPA: 8-amino-7-oxononanoate synthase [Candidatus Brocadiia bacterium]|mgnify:CR=1 FL=1|nr:8-amino-7-oxononanoate synthase [Candidatus Brocadiia bacterium]